MSSLTITYAGALNADNIGTLIRFRQWNNNTETATVITAELRQISHSGGRTFLHFGTGADQEETLEYEQPVSLKPPANYSDVATLAMYDEKV